MVKILVIDDEEDLKLLMKQRFRKQIKQDEYEFVFAENGKDGLQKLIDVPDIDLILSDINMPVMDGLTFLSRLKDNHKLIKTVMVSAYGDMQNIRTAMNRGAFDFVTKPIDFKDLQITIDKTVDHISELKKTLEAFKENNILRMYVDETVLNFMSGREVEQSLFENELEDGSVAFIDICGFTSISENEPAEKVVTMLNSYFDVIVQEVIKHNGIVDKFLGDAVMASFKDDKHLERAVACCLVIQQKFKDIEYQTDELYANPQLSIGINCGEMVWGNIGSSTLRRLDYTVIGDTVNTAARLQAAAEKGQILVNEQCYQLMKDSFDCEKVSEITMRNKKKPQIVYEVKRKANSE
jgi:class 3 adenylate cyclase